MNARKVRISKFLSYILRHNPDKFNLPLDKNGYAPINGILVILKEKFAGFSKEELSDLIKTDPKGRFAIQGDKIRATYGHSLPIELTHKPVEPEQFLYHGTSRSAAVKILKEGLKPMHRQFVHLSGNKEDAFGVGLRHTHKPVILKVKAKEAHSRGIEFFKEKDTYLAKYIPGKFICLAK